MCVEGGGGVGGGEWSGKNAYACTGGGGGWLGEKRTIAYRGGGGGSKT